MDWRDSSGEEAWISSFLLSDRCREEEEEEEMAREMVSLSCCREHELGTSIFRVSLDSKDLSLSFIVLILTEANGNRKPSDKRFQCLFQLVQPFDESFCVCKKI